MIELDGGVVLPNGKGKGFSRPEGVGRTKWQSMKKEMWKRAYMHCLYSLPLHFDLPLHSVVPRLAKKMMESTDPFNVSLRFIGEMELAGYVKFERGFNERVVVPTKKFLKLELDCDRAPESAIKLPVVDGYIPRAPIRGGISNEANKEATAICSSMSNLKFEMNHFILNLVKQFPPEFEKSSDAYMYKRMLVCADIMGDSKFRFPYFLDSRGRIYTDTTCGFNPQGSDHEKAILLPTYTEVLTEDGFLSLVDTAIGYSEIEWSVDEMISHAISPEEHVEEWKKADKPFSYMACAHLLLQHRFDPSKPLPAFSPLDGRCSGLQHWSAVIRSNSITRHLGMHEEEADLDIYEKVADDWKVTLTEEYQHYATRKAAKIPVMTWGYSATMMTSMDWLSKLFGAKTKWDDDIGKYVVVDKGLDRATTSRMGCDLYNGMQRTLGPLQSAVDWVCDASVCIANAGNVEIRWPTPDGFTGLQRKVKGERLKLRATLSDGEELLLEILDFSKEKPNPAKHKSAIAPNLIHGLDATHLRMTARRMEEAGLPAIFIHDSFSTHCNHRASLYGIIVATFMELYDMDYLTILKVYWEDLYGVKLPKPPALGSWSPESLVSLDRFFI